MDQRMFCRKHLQPSSEAWSILIVGVDYTRFRPGHKLASVMDMANPMWSPGLQKPHILKWKTLYNSQQQEREVHSKTNKNQNNVLKQMTSLSMYKTIYWFAPKCHEALVKQGTGTVNTNETWRNL